MEESTDPRPVPYISCWYVYLLFNGSRTYIGATTDPHRRLRQHNGEIRGGAKSTSRFHGQWKLVCYIAGFTSRSEAYRWEKILKSRSRGYQERYDNMLNLVVKLQCPRKNGRKQYPIPENLTFHYDVVIE